MPVDELPSWAGAATLPQTDDWATAWEQQAMTEQPRVQTAASTAERRLVTALFADIVDSTAIAERLDPEDWSAAIGRAIELMKAPVERHGGIVVRVMGDGLLALFGAPAAHEDDAIRATAAGLEMVADVASAGPALRRDVGKALQIRVGINTGLAIVEGVGQDSAQVDALGDTINVAARMQSAARPGTVLVTGETWRSAKAAYEGVALGGLQIKGKAEPVDAWEIQGLLAEPGSGRGLTGLASPLVGREEQMARLAELLHAVRAGRGRAAVILGEPGVGKSRLLAEARARDLAAVDGLRWVEARSVSYGDDVAYGLLSDVMLACLGLPGRATRTATLEGLESRLGDVLGGDAASHAAILANLLSLPLPAGVADELAPLSPEALRTRYEVTAEVVLRRISAERPLVLVADDIHWADASSADVLGQLLSLGHELRILFVLSGRPDRGTAGWRLVEAARNTFGDALSELTLAPLDEAGSRSLVANLLEIESLPEPLRRFILERAEGNPFFVEEVIRMLIERDWVVERDGRWVGSATIASAEVPPTLAGLLTARIDRLPVASRRILRVGAVIGRDIPARLLEAVIGDAAATARALGEAEAVGLVRIASIDPEPVYRFRHVLVQEAAYDSLLKADRRRLHGDVAEAIETRYSDRLEELAPILGLHFERAGVGDRAVQYLHRAGRAALRRFAVHEARDLLDRAAALLVDLPDDVATERRRIEVALDRITAGATFIPYDQQLAELAETRARAAELGDDRLLGLTLALEAAERRSLGDPALEEATDAALEIGHRLNDPHILGGPLGIKGLILARQGRRTEGTGFLEQAVVQLEGIETAAAAYYAGELGVIQAELGEFALADRTFVRARNLAERSGDPTALADVDIFEGMSLAMQGRHDEALALAHRGATGAAAVGNLSCEAVGSWVAGEQELALGAFDRAIQWLEKANDIAGYCQALNVERMSAATLGVARAKAGAGAAALHGLDELLEQARAAEDPLSEALILLRRGEANATVENGDPAQAKADLEASMAILRAIETRPYLDQAERLYRSLSAR